jgi:2-keto-3-deoxy-L-rhamnonate aldolase RhmA
MGSSFAAEACALGGFDWLLVDLEHGAGGEEGLVGQLLAGAVHDVPVFVRVETNERIRIGHALDLGAAGIMFPRVSTVEEVREVVSHLWYPPRGGRGVAGYNRARQFGADARGVEEVNDSLLGLVQIETLAALENVEEIAAIPGVDVLFVGPSDLSTGMGIPGQFDEPVFVAALDRVASAAKNANIAAGILAFDVDRAKAFSQGGYSFVGVGSDSSLLRQGALAAATALRA